MRGFYRSLKEYLIAIGLFLLAAVCLGLFGFEPDVQRWMKDSKNRSS